MRIYKKGKKGTYYVDIRRPDGSRERKSLGTADEKIARAIAGNMEKQVLFQEHFGTIPPYPFEKALFRYAEYLKNKNPSNYKKTARFHIEVLWGRFDGLNCHEITFATIQDFMEARSEEVALATVQKELGMLKALLNRAVREERLERPPVFPRMQSLQGRYRFLSEDEEKLLFDQAAPHLKTILIAALDTGGRRGEILSLDWSRVSMDRRTVTFTKTKNGKDRTVGMTKRLHAVLQKIGPQKAGPVFTYRGRAIEEVTTAFGKAIKRAGIEDFRFHDLRHTFASRLVQAGMSLYKVQVLMGHQSPQMVQRYAHLAPDHYKEATEALDGYGHQKGTVLSANDNQYSAKSLRKMVLSQGIEPWTSPLPRECSTPELRQRYRGGGRCLAQAGRCMP
jgi:integrase